ncbi:MAG: DUF2927 domain-containing protein [Paracoccaceae bacterium]
MRTLLLAALCAATPALGSDGIETSGPLSDADFLRLLTCGAAPENACQMDQVRWRDPGQLTIGFGPIPKGYAPQKAAMIAEALDRAITTVNAVGADVQLRRVAHTDDPDITLRPTLFYENDAVYGEPGVTDGSQIGSGYVYVFWDDKRFLTQATILIARDIYDYEIDSIVLEEVTQSLGFLFDIENPDYENVSIFAQDSNSVLSLTGQDAAVLQLYYPR